MNLLKYFLLLLFLLPDTGFTQDSLLLDSLQNELKKFETHKLEMRGTTPELSDTLKAGILYKLSRVYWGNTPEKGKEYAGQLLKLSEQIGFKKGIANAYLCFGAINQKQGNYKQAFKYCNKSLALAKSINYKLLQADALSYLGSINTDQANYLEALKNIYEALKIAEEIKDKSRIASAYNCLGGIYYEEHNYPEALQAFSSGLKISEEIGLKEIGGAYLNVGQLHSAMGNNSEALKYYLNGVQLLKKTGNKHWEAYGYGNIGDLLIEQGKHEEALIYLTMAVKMLKDFGDRPALGWCLNSVGYVQFKLKKYPKARKYITDALKLLVEAGEVGNIELCYERLAAIDSATGNWKSAYENHKKFILYRDSLLNDAAAKKTAQMQMQYNFDKKEAETKALTDAELNKQKMLRNGFVGGFAIVLIFAGVFFRQRNKTKKEKQRSDVLLLNILPYEVAEELKEKGTAQAKQFDEVSVLFTDFVDFTQTAENLSPQQIVQELNECFTAFDKIIERNGLEKIKTIGDAYMAVCGLPTSDSRHAQNTVQAALEIREFIEERRKHERVFEVRIGINSGSVVAGIVGIKKFSYDIWGDTVNVAARMEQNCTPGNVNISESTYQLVKGEFDCIARGTIAAKGKGEVEMYFVEAVS